MTRKRGNNEGTIRKRSDGRWEARITLEDESRKSMYGATRQEAASRMAELLRNLAKGLPVVGERQTVHEYLTSWLATVKPTIESTTWQRYSEYVRLHTVRTYRALPPYSPTGAGVVRSQTRGGPLANYSVTPPHPSSQCVQ
jgi:integrase